MEPPILIDTTILIELLRGNQKTRELFEKWKNTRLATSHINAFELYFSAHRSEKKEQNIQSVKGLLNALHLLPTTEDSMEGAVAIAAKLTKEGSRIEIRDLLI